MGILDGRNLENRSVPLVKMEVDVATLAQFLQEVADRIAADAAEALARGNADTTLQNNINAHTGTQISTAHAGLINSPLQLQAASIAIGKLDFVPVIYSEYAAHTADNAKHIANGSTYSINISGNAATATNATNAGYATNAGHATNADYAPSAGNADTLDGQHAANLSVNYANSSGTSGYANSAGVASAAYYSN
jgi:hypothetical protein